MERIGRDYPDSSLPDLELGDLLRQKLRFSEAIDAYDRMIGRFRRPVARPTGSWGIAAASPMSARGNGRGPRRISIARWNCRPISLSC